MDYLNFITNHIHTVVMATVDDTGLPITCAIDLMDSDKDGLYFLTAKGKGFYNRLKKSSYVALTGIKGNDTLSCIAVSICGNVREIGNDRLQDILNKNGYMNEIYPTEQSRQALTVFQLYEGTGEWFDLSQKPIERASFTIGNSHEKVQGYQIISNCIGCKSCEKVCPQKCIDFDRISAVIRQENCLHCGNCFTVCPQKAVIQRGKKDDTI